MEGHGLWDVSMTGEAQKSGEIWGHSVQYGGQAEWRSVCFWRRACNSLHISGVAIRGGKRSSE